jgi:hypothetical protein
MRVNLTCPAFSASNALPGPVVPPADHLDALFRKLVENLIALDPTAVHRPVRVAEIADRLVPYRTHRAMLGFDTNEDYEMTILRLLAGERGLAQVFPADVADTLAREANSVNPDPGLFHQFPDATVVLDASRSAPAPSGALEDPEASLDADPEPESEAPEALEREVEQLEDDVADTSRGGLTFSLDETEENPAPVARPREVTASAPCPYCGAGLPVGRTVLFCPHCGQNIGVVHCQTCGSELDVGWTFCIACGQKLQGLG